MEYVLTIDEISGSIRLVLIIHTRHYDELVGDNDQGQQLNKFRT